MLIKTVFIWTFYFIGILTSLAQPNSINTYPVESCTINYEFEGNTEGERELYFENYGQKMAVYTYFTRSNTFYSIVTTSNENVAEYLLDGTYYHIDIEHQKVHKLNPPAHMMVNYVQNAGKSSDYREDLELAGASLVGTQKLLDLECEHWTYKSKEFLIWNGILLKMTSRGLKKNFSMKATSIDFENEIPTDRFSFPADIVIPD